MCLNLRPVAFLPDRPKPIVALSLDVVTNDASNGDDDATPSPHAGTLDGDSHVTDALFEAMSNRRARYVLSYLDSVSVDVLELDDLADGVAEWEIEAGVATDPGECRHRVTVDLHHHHLPKLAEAGLVDYDPRTKTVRNWGDDRIRACLDLFQSVERS